ncbi:MAG TPA: hypothetical protein EYO01_05190 [Phycisphaerales bacterium]|nr:hypothetical protein [Phycisphaerales bacterium]HIO52302.1 hypothetical protein [Phycisphaerales bacterium]
MLKSCAKNGGSCPAPWILVGVGLGVVVGLLTEKIGMWIGIGAGAGLLLYAIRYMCSCSGSCSATNSDEDAGGDSNNE